jgi:lipopolysaccharide/colanic/teichoic acid biosynthesis glycosyltransferase
MLRTTKAKAAATITNAIITIADSIPMTPRRVFLLFVDFIRCHMTCPVHIILYALVKQTSATNVRYKYDTIDEMNTSIISNKYFLLKNKVGVL